MTPFPTNGKICRDCKWCDGTNCHRFPPQMVPWPASNEHPIYYEPQATFPYVGPNDWCGEWSKSP